ncbi:NAD(+)/NADH kinase [Tumebacillus sp. ITR2]|uniref:NAD kinase n=1 Tax=Tumebacillus amylolyticus TaxID=2801339 RepID=A0ABS1JCU3_9BACL|nr:NAD(+)/NADH kinase [Tumebacillus amylolyticus]MBL0388102.1 NAD(+)/NADH kinase [Tumebacillus amylolyticus]
MKTIGLAVNPTKPTAIPVTQNLVEIIERHGAHVFVDEESAEKIGRPELGIPQSDFPSRVEILFVLGGDGTILGFARQFAKTGLPMLGINLGHLGFLSEAEPKDMENAVQRVLAGDYCLEERLMLEAQVIRGGQVLHEAVGLNDVAIAKGSFGRMVTNRVFVDDMYVDQYTGDGLLVSTPTGSTAYSLSCGGPVVSPHIDVIVLTPICPHTLHSRPMVIAANQEVRVEVEATHDELVLSVDGQLFYELENHDVIRVRQAGYKTTLIKWRDREFFDVLRRKLHVAT